MIFMVWFTYERKKHARDYDKQKEAFWSAESGANIVRKVNLDTLEYIAIPLDALPFGELQRGAFPTGDDGGTAGNSDIEGNADNYNPNIFDVAKSSSIAECEKVIRYLSTQRILNLTGMTSTDIKLKYGAANLDKLDTYDNNYTLLVQTLYKWGELLVRHGRTEDAIRVLEFGVECFSDVSGTYKLLAELYVNNNEAFKIDHLIETAGHLHTLMRSSIIKNLTDMRNSAETPQH